MLNVLTLSLKGNFEFTFVKKCDLYFKTYILDNELESKLLEESDSPTDRGKDIFEELLLNKKEYKN